MARIGGWWLASHSAPDDETVLGSFHVNRLRLTGRPIGGKLFLTDRRLLFSPHLIDAWFGGNKHGIELAHVAAVRRDSLDVGGGRGAETDDSRDILAIDVDDGSVDRYVIDDLEAAIADIEAAIVDARQ